MREARKKNRARKGFWGGKTKHLKPSMLGLRRDTLKRGDGWRWSTIWEFQAPAGRVGRLTSRCCWVSDECWWVHHSPPTSATSTTLTSCPFARTMRSRSFREPSRVGRGNSFKFTVGNGSSTSNESLVRRFQHVFLAPDQCLFRWIWSSWCRKLFSNLMER